MRFKLVMATLLSVTVISCGGSGGGSRCGGSSDEIVSISGTVTYDRVPHRPDGSLDYNNISRDPVRGATVVFIDPNDVELATTSTDEQGRYRVDIASNTEARLRVLAELSKQDGPVWDVRVTDNTRGASLYVLQGESICSGTSAGTRDLHADSGWTGSSYSEERQAAPFAILDSVYDVLLLLSAADADLTLRPVELRWSTNNIAVEGNPFIGEIGTSFFDGSFIYILGDEDDDTDEYDSSVVQHEFTHFLEGSIFRGDTVGGPHTVAARLDMRVAFSEGFANAIPAITNGNGAYLDSRGNRQSGGFRISLESSNTATSGWFNEDSVGLIVYDIHDASNEDGDNIAAGFAPIYAAMTSDEFRLGSAFTSIFSFADALKATVNDENDAAIDLLLSGQDISGSGPYGTGENNSGGTFDALPVYHELRLGDVINLCSSPIGGQFNGIGVRRFIRVFIEQEDEYRFFALKTLGSTGRSPEFVLYRDRDVIEERIARELDSAGFNIELAPDEYILEFYDYNNINFDLPAERACFDLSLTTTD